MLVGERAIIIGGGIAGKLAARVVSDYFTEVLVIERDPKPEGPTPRKGAPQGEHLHALLHAGENGLESLFPGITEEFYASGAIKINSTNDLAWFHHGVWKQRYHGEFSTILQSRPQLEWHIEKYMRRIPNVSYLHEHSVLNYLYNKEENRIYGVEIKDKNSSITQESGELVIDASGVSSLSTNWLTKQGIVIPEEKLNIGLSYITKQYRLPEHPLRDWTIKLLYPNPPHEKIGGTISKVEGDRYIITCFGYENEINLKELLEDEDNGFIDLTKKLPKLDIYEELKNGTPLTKTSIYKVPHISWKRFDKVDQLPTGLLLLGDTVCRIDPVFGQGMSLAVLEALALQKLLKNRTSTPLPRITKLFHKDVSKIISPVWTMVISEIFRFPNVTGKKPIGLAVQQWYSKNIFLLSSQNQEVYNTFIKVMNLVRPTTILFHPNVLLPLIRRTIFKK